jgi:hypothetical protein
MEIHQTNARLPLRIKGDAPAFVTKRRHASSNMSPFTHVIRDALTKCASRFSHKRERIFDLK